MLFFLYLGISPRSFVLGSEVEFGLAAYYEGFVGKCVANQLLRLFYILTRGQTFSGMAVARLGSPLGHMLSYRCICEDGTSRQIEIRRPLVIATSRDVVAEVYADVLTGPLTTCKVHKLAWHPGSRSAAIEGRSRVMRRMDVSGPPVNAAQPSPIPQQGC